MVGKELDTAVKQIDRAKELVLDKIHRLQRPHSRLVGTAAARRTDVLFRRAAPQRGETNDRLQGGLSVNPDRSAPKVRDVIAVFSHSQLHCLGLALFLARAQHEGLGFIILDDPVLSSDEDYRVISTRRC